MFLRPLIRRPPKPPHPSHHHIHTSPPKPSFPTTPKCPSPSCSCAPTPTLPPNLPIDNKTALNGTMAPYAEQVLICTGKDDWMSRIEEEGAGDNLAADLRELLGRGGGFADPYHSTPITNASFPSTTPSHKELHNTSAYLFPSFKYIPFLPRVSFDSVQALVKGYILPSKLHPAHDALSPIHRDRLTRKEGYQALLYGVSDVRDVVVLICGHGGRDARCGIMGPVLRGEFEDVLGREGVCVQRGEVLVRSPAEVEERRLLGEKGEEEEVGRSARVGLISHIGGHKFAGNVIVYIPPGMKMKDGRENPLAGTGVWYGRVTPAHVEGIVRETVLGGRVIEELFRGGVRKGGEILRL